MGRAINKAVTIAEILKRKMPLHQINCLSSSEIVDIFEPLEEGLDVVESKRYVSCMTITLSITQEGIDVNDIGYQVCLPFVEIFFFIY
jgi:ribonuclease P/MRP protein subunit RPP25